MIKDVRESSLLFNSDGELEQLSKQIAKGGGIGLIGTVLGRVSGVGLHFLLSRVLGATGYGLYALGFSLMGIAQSVTSLGLQSGVVRFCAIYRGDGNNAQVKGTLIAALGMSLASSLLASTILFVFAPKIALGFFNDIELISVVKVFALALPFHVIMAITTSFAQALRRIEYQTGIRDVFYYLTNLIFVLLAFILGFRLGGAIFGLLGAGVLSAGLGFWSIWEIFPEIGPGLRPTFHGIGKLIKFSAPMIIITMAYFLAFQTDRIMLGLLRSTRDVGIYSAGSNIALQLGLVYSALVSIAMPIIADIYNRRPSQLGKLYNLITRWLSYGVFLSSLPVIFYPKLIMWLFGNEFIQGWILVLVLPLTFIIGGIVGPTEALLLMAGKQNVELFNSVLLVASNVVLNLILIPTFGFHGAALATVLSVAIGNLVQVVQVYRYFSFHPFSVGHIYFILLAIIVFLTAILANIFWGGYIKLFVFFAAGATCMAYGYKTKTPQDDVIWIVVKKKLQGYKQYLGLCSYP